MTHMEGDSFGCIELTDSSEVIFFTDIFKGNKYANIRKFIKTQKYTGPTKQGIKLNGDQLQKIIDKLKTIPKEIHAIETQEVLSIPSYQNKHIKVNVDFYRGQYWIDFRVYYETEFFKGPTKKGVKIPFHYLMDTIRYLEEMNNHINCVSIETKNDRQEVIPEESEEGEKIEGVPDEYKKYFE